MALDIDRQPAYVVFRFHGTMTPVDLEECARVQAEIDDASPAPPDRVGDLSPVETFQVNFLAVSDLAKKRRERRYGRTVKSALVADRPVAVGFARMYQTILNHPDVDVQIFPSLQSALDWLSGREPAPGDGPPWSAPPGGGPATDGSPGQAR